MPGQSAEPLSLTRPHWVGLAGHLAPDPGRAWLRPGDAVHARMLRHLAARALHEPLLAVLPSVEGTRDASSPIVRAGTALRALLPGKPKPVAALTRSPEVTGSLLGALASAAPASELLHELAAQVLFGLALSDALHEPVVLTGPLVLTHTASRRGITLHAGQQLVLGGAAPRLDERALDPWGPELGAALTEHHGFAVPRTALAALPALEDALGHVTLRDRHAESLADTLVALELAPLAVADGELGLPLAIGRARLPACTDAPTLAHALLRESALQKLTVLRLVDPLVHDEAALSGLLRAVNAWAAARLGLPTAVSMSCDPAALTTLGRQVLAELTHP